MGLGERGKEECWLVLEAEPGAAVALGLDDTYDEETVRKAAGDGSIEDMLVWHDAKAGDFFYVPAGTIHAIGPGLVLLEVQQNTDMTFRFYDYGRPRELHLDQAMRCAKLEPYSEVPRNVFDPCANAPLLETKALWVDVLSDQNVLTVEEPTLVIPIAGQIEAGSEILAIGDCGLIQPGETLRSKIDSRFVVARGGNSSFLGKNAA